MGDSIECSMAGFADVSRTLTWTVRHGAHSLGVHMHVRMATHTSVHMCIDTCINMNAGMRVTSVKLSSPVIKKKPLTRTMRGMCVDMYVDMRIEGIMEDCLDCANLPSNIR